MISSAFVKTSTYIKSFARETPSRTSCKNARQKLDEHQLKDYPVIKHY